MGEEGMMGAEGIIPARPDSPEGVSKEPTSEKGKEEGLGAKGVIPAQPESLMGVAKEPGTKGKVEGVGAEVIIPVRPGSPARVAKELVVWKGKEEGMVAKGVIPVQPNTPEGVAKKSGKKRKVCVTGGAGFVASWLVKKLLERGYSVRVTVRSDPKFKEETGHLTSLLGAIDNLEIFDADLTRPESFVPAFDGCIGVFHVATPTDFGSEDYDRTAVEVAVEGVLGVLRACAAARTVRRVVYTSSASAVMFSRRRNGVNEPAGGGTLVLDESVWTDEEFCRAQDVPISAYFVSKTLAERAALDFAAEHGLDVVSVLPSSVVGPFLVPHFPTSYVTSLALLRGDREHCKLLGNMQFVHIDDVAAAHVFLFECPEAHGRYLCSATDTTIRSLAGFLRGRFTEFHISDELVCTGGGDVGMEEEEEEEPAVRLSSKKLRSLGFEFKYGLEEMFDGAILCCMQRGFLEPTHKKERDEEEGKM